MQLYKITNEYLALQSDESFTAEEITDTLEAIEGEFDDKAENIFGLIKSLILESVAFKTEAKRLTTIANAKANTAEKLKGYLQIEMVKLKKKSIVIGTHSAKFRKGSKAVEILDLDDIPDEYVNVKTDITPDKKLLLKALKALEDDETIAGAKLITNPDTLTIK